MEIVNPILTKVLSLGNVGGVCIVVLASVSPTVSHAQQEGGNGGVSQNLGPPQPLMP